MGSCAVERPQVKACVVAARKGEEYVSSTTKKVTGTF
jgi:hypothetical protein